MNLVKLQNDLREQPTSKIMEYANGASPLVPAYLALAELNRRKVVQQKKAEPPEQTLKEKIEDEVKLLQTNAGRQQEAMQRQGEALGQQYASAPKSTPATDAEAFADGGLTRLRSGLRFNRGGGIVAFAEGDSVIDEATRQSLDRNKKYMDLLEQQKEYLPKSPADILEELKKTRPELAQPAGARMEKFIEEISARDKQDRERFKQEQERRLGRRMSDAFTGAGQEMARFKPSEQKGLAGIMNLLGGFGRQATALEESDIDRLNKQRLLEREQDIGIAKMQDEIEKARRAEARGDYAAQAEHEKNVATIRTQLQANKITAFKGAADISETARKNLVSENIARLQLDAQRAQVARMGPQVLQVMDYLRKRHPEWDEAKIMDESVKLANPNAETNRDRMFLQINEKIQQRFEKQRIHDPMIISATEKKDPAKAQKMKDENEDVLKKIKTEVYNEYGATPTGINSLPSGDKSKGQNMYFDAKGNPIQKP